MNGSKIEDFSQYYAGQVADHFHVDEGRIHEREAMFFMFRVMEEFAVVSQGNNIQKNRQVAQEAIERISGPLAAYREYKDDFFLLEEGINYDALNVAVICDEYIEFASTPAPGNDDPNEPTVFQYDNIDTDILLQADKIWNEATSMGQTGLPGNDETHSRESRFLAHIHGNALLENIGNQDPGHYADEDIARMMEKDVKPLYSVADEHTAIGRELLRRLEIAEHAMTMELRDRTRKRRPAGQPFLTIVPTL